MALHSPTLHARRQSRRKSAQRLEMGHHSSGCRRHGVSRRAADEALLSDLALVAASDMDNDLALAVAGGVPATVVSSIENPPAPSPRPVPVPSRKRGKATPPPEAAAVAEASDEETAEAPEVVAVAPAEVPEVTEAPAPDAPPVVRPQPIEPRYPVGGGSGIYGTGRDDGIGAGGVTVVIRGGRTGRDPCLPGERRGGGRTEPGMIGTIISINNRVPGRGTFPRR